MTGTNERHALASFDPRRRARMVECLDGSPVQPAWLFLTERGTPMSRQAWWAVFEAANRRVAKFGYDIRITPHTLRHTFAIHMLSRLIEQEYGRGAAQEIQRTDAAMYRQVYGNPLRTVQRLLGHRYIETTMGYLTYLGESEELIDRALGEWDDDVHWGSEAA